MINAPVVLIPATDTCKNVTMDKFQKWVRSGLQQPGKTAKGLAAALGVAPARVTEITKGDRKVKATEITRIALYLELPPPSDQISYTSVSVGQVPVMGRIEDGVWRERIKNDTQDYAALPHVIDERFPPDSQIAYVIETPAPEAGLIAGDYVIAAPYSAAHLKANRRCMVVVQIEKHNLVSLALATLTDGADGNLNFLIPSGYSPIAVRSAKILAQVIAIHRPLI